MKDDNQGNNNINATNIPYGSSGPAVESRSSPGNHYYHHLLHIQNHHGSSNQSDNPGSTISISKSSSFTQLPSLASIASEQLRYHHHSHNHNHEESGNQMIDAKYVVNDAIMGHAPLTSKSSISDASSASLLSPIYAAEVLRNLPESFSSGGGIGNHHGSNNNNNSSSSGWASRQIPHVDSPLTSPPGLRGPKSPIAAMEDPYSDMHNNNNNNNNSSNNLTSSRSSRRSSSRVGGEELSHHRESSEPVRGADFIT